MKCSCCDGAKYRAAALANQVRLIPVAAPRGIIYDRHGAVLVRSRPSFVVGLIPSQVDDIDAELATLASTLGVDPGVLRFRLLHHRGVNYHNFDEVVTNEPYGPVVLAKDLPVATVARLSELLTELPGVDLEVQPTRDYPYGPYGSHLFGYVGAITEQEYQQLKQEGYSPNDVVGKDGLEYTYDRYLRGVPGGQRVVVDSTGAVVSSVSVASRHSRRHARHQPRLAPAADRRTGAGRRHSQLGSRAQALRRRGGRRSVDRRNLGAGQLSELRSARLFGRPLQTRAVRSDGRDRAAIRSRDRARPRRPDRRLKW